MKINASDATMTSFDDVRILISWNVFLISGFACCAGYQQLNNTMPHSMVPANIFCMLLYGMALMVNEISRVWAIETGIRYLLTKSGLKNEIPITTISGRNIMRKSGTVVFLFCLGISAIQKNMKRKTDSALVDDHIYHGVPSYPRNIFPNTDLMRLRLTGKNHDCLNF